MFEDIQKHRQAVRENIEKSLQIGFTESEDFEKAHQVGDIHPNGKWVWTQLPSGKFDWRVIKLDKPGGNRALNQISDKQRQTYEEIENLINHGKRLTTAQANFYNNLKPSMDKLKKQASASQSQKTEGKEVEVDKNSSEYKKAFSAAKRWASEIDERGREVELSAIKENLEAAKEIAENKDGKWSRNDVIRAKNSIVSETARKDAFEDVEKELKKKTEKKGKTANLGEYYSSTLRGPKDVEEFFSDIRKKKISFDVLGMKRSDGTYDKVGRITGGKLGSQYDSYAVQVNIRWYGDSSNEKRQFASIADFKKFLVNVG